MFEFEELDTSKLKMSIKNGEITNPEIIEYFQDDMIFLDDMELEDLE